MPLYDLFCTHCHRQLNDYYARKSENTPICCGERMRKKVGTVNIGFPKGGITLTNVEDKPVHFETKSKLKKYTRDNNLELGAL